MKRLTAFATAAGLLFNALAPAVTLARGTPSEKNQELVGDNLFVVPETQIHTASYRCDTKADKTKPAISVSFLYAQKLQGNFFSGSVISFNKHNPTVNKVIVSIGGNALPTMVIGDVPAQQVQQVDSNADKWFLACFKAAHEGKAKIWTEEGQFVLQPKAKNVNDLLWGQPSEEPVVTHQRYNPPPAPGCRRKGSKTSCLL